MDSLTSCPGATLFLCVYCCAIGLEGMREDVAGSMGKVGSDTAKLYHTDCCRGYTDFEVRRSGYIGSVMVNG